ncbi:MAG: endonuclease [Bacteroidia bacterium]
MKRFILAIITIAPFQLFAQTLTSSVSSLPSFGNCVINLATAAQKFTISGSGLTNEVTLTTSTSFEIATNCVSQYTSNPILLNIESGILSNTTVFVRLSPSVIGNVSGTVNIKSIGANEVNISVSGVSTNWNIPTANGNYYSSTTDLSGAELKTALFNKIAAHSVTSYSGLWNTYSTTDNFYNGKVWDIYSTNICGVTPYNYSFGTNQCGSYSKESDCYNREHSFPQSWFGSASPMVSDMFHIYPTDGKVNGERNNYPYGEVSSATFTSLQGGKLGANTFPGYSGIVFEPIDEYKGDLARTYFYMATRYENLIAGWQNNGNANDILAGNSFPVYDQWVIDLMIKWHNQDPVSLKEINRNNAIYGYQQNRNPFIDSPQFVQRIWIGNCPNKPTIVSSNATVELPKNLPLKVSLKWQSGNGNRRLVLIKANAPVDEIPFDSFEYIAISILGAGSEIGNGNYVVYNGMGSEVNISHFNVEMNYYFAIFEYNGYQKTAQYFASPFRGSFNTIPVYIDSFSVKLIDSKTSSLNWKTVSERNNDRFEIERSIDSTNWINRGTLKSIGNSVLPTDYSFTDSLPFVSNIKQLFYYRLKQIGLDTSYQYSKTENITIDNTSIENFKNMSAEWLITPNPFTNQLRMYVTLQTENLCNITIKNILGNEVFNLSKNIYQGKQVITINELDLLPNGIYILQLQCGNENVRHRIIKQQ